MSLARKLLLGVGGISLPTSEFILTRHNGDSETVYTYASAGNGSLSKAGLIVVGVTGQSQSNLLSSAKIGGVSATLHIQDYFTTIISLPGSAGAIPDIELTFAASQGRSGIGIWGLYDLDSNTPIDTDSEGSNTNATRDVSLDLTKDAIAIISGYRAGTSEVSFSNATERFSVVMESAVRHLGGDYQAAGSETVVFEMNSVASIAGVVWR